VPQPRKPRTPKAAVVEPTPDETTEVKEPTPIRPPLGHRPPARWIRTTADWNDSTDDSLPLSAEINVAGLTVLNTGWLWEPGLLSNEVWDFLADRVRDWNAMAYDHESRSWVIAQSPAEIGWKAFTLVDSSFLVETMLLVNRAILGGDARPKSVAS